VIFGRESGRHRGAPPSSHYPDPENVVYPTTLPPGFPCELTSRDAGKMYPIHDHGAYLNADGDGTTDVTAGHYHRVRGGRVLPDESDGHTHRLTGLPCGAGAVSRRPGAAR
jgi:hypothetical protein